MTVDGKKRVLVTTLIILEFFTLFLLFKTLSINLFSSKQIKEEKEIIKSEMFAIMLGDINGNYQKSNDNTWPSKYYIYNASKSGCIDSNGNLLKNSLTYDENTKKAKVVTDVNTYCYLYFDLNTTVPKDFVFYLGINADEVVNTQRVDAFISFEEDNIVSYCLTSSSTSDNCTWNSVSSKTITTTYNLSSGDGEKKVYAYLKNDAEIVSEGIYDTIKLDMTKPVIKDVSADVSSNSLNIIVDATDNFDVIYYYYSIDGGSYTFSGNNNFEFLNLSPSTNYTISVYAIDLATNESDVYTKTFTTDGSSCILGEQIGNYCVIYARDQGWFDEIPTTITCSRDIEVNEANEEACGCAYNKCHEDCDLNHSNDIEDCKEACWIGTYSCIIPYTCTFTKTEYYDCASTIKLYYCDGDWSVYDGEDSNLRCSQPIS